ncbi:MAG TPA: 23S rRNA (adenine(2503)-C(2))-methyltransferase RlmN [Tissierellaceae bacterium]|nr:23S rRNA (adenine(2503)-C(2))-methyltransferase RlmN [Tissierellaceae bacterium]
MHRLELNSMSLLELKDFFISINEKSFRGEQAFTYFHKNNKWELKNLKVLPLKLREELIETTRVNEIKLDEKFSSKIDETDKYLFVLEDNNIIESVAMKYKHGTTVCISTQVGCKMGCSFCASTKEGLIRDLTPAEMLNQIYMIEKDLNKDISNIVLMGSGEPLDNYENTLKFLNIIHHEKGHNISYRNITLSTCGIVPRIYDLAKENLPITLSVSLHSAFDEARKEIMPIANKYSIKEIMEACKYYETKTKRRITFEYTLIDGVNDREKDARELSKILRGLNAHVNLIALNPIKEYEKQRSSKSNIEKFKQEMTKYNIPVTIRREMGSDISASCGQLRRSIINKN